LDFQSWFLHFITYYRKNQYLDCILPICALYCTIFVALITKKAAGGQKPPAAKKVFCQENQILSFIS
jgi:hypothetical protein